MDVQVAISHAVDFARRALPAEQNLTVEEIEYKAEGEEKAWYITLGFKRLLPRRKSVDENIIQRYVFKPSEAEYEDVYKLIIVPEDGGTPKMKIRKV